MSNDIYAKWKPKLIDQRTAARIRGKRLEQGKERIDISWPAHMTEDRLKKIEECEVECTLPELRVLARLLKTTAEELQKPACTTVLIPGKPDEEE